MDKEIVIWNNVVEIFKFIESEELKSIVADNVIERLESAAGDVCEALVLIHGARELQRKIKGRE